MSEFKSLNSKSIAESIVARLLKAEGLEPPELSELEEDPFDDLDDELPLEEEVKPSTKVSGILDRIRAKYSATE